MRILITGGAGFIGSNFVRRLAQGAYPQWSDAEITVLDKLTYAGSMANLEEAAGRFSFVHGDICDSELLAVVVPGQDIVINFAAESHVDRSIASPSAFVRTNVQGVQALMQACLDAGTPRILHVSTDEVYGSVALGSWDEDAALAPNSPYAAAKAGGDLIARSYAHTYGLPVSITRCGNNYGPYQHPEKVIPLFITNLLDGLPVPLYGDGMNIREWIHVDDHCRGIQLATEKGEPGMIYHVGGGTELTNAAMTERLLKFFGLGWEMVEKAPDRLGHDWRYSLAGTRLRSLGYAPEISFDQGIADTIRWYRDNRHVWQPLKSLPTTGRHRNQRYVRRAAAGDNEPEDRSGPTALPAVTLITREKWSF